MTTTFASLNPATGDRVGEHPVHDEAAVAAAVERARQAAYLWHALGWGQRRNRLLAWKGTLTRRLTRLAQLISDEMGKPLVDAQLEVVLAIVHLDWAAKHAHRVLGRRRVRSGLLGVNLASTVEYQPYGVVGVIGPWNYPVFTPMGSIAYALAAGNAVVFKPSEFTPAVGRFLAETFSEHVQGAPILQTVTGFGATGQALAADPGVDKIAFTGSPATARKVMAACARNLTPLVAECGGKDAVIVDAGADLDAAAEATLWGAMSNAGQTCIGTERVYVVADVFDQFTARLTQRARELRPGEDREADYGPIAVPAQLDVIERQIEDAVARGGHALVGGAGAVHPPYVDPVILVDVPEGAAAMREETFGPVITVTKVADAEEAVGRANAVRYGLGAAVFSRDRSRAEDLARRIRSGMTSINTVMSYAAVPALPYGGVGESGFGRIHGADGLREFARPKAITRQRFPLPGEVASFRRSTKDVERMLRLVLMLHNRRAGSR